MSRAVCTKILGTQPEEENTSTTNLIGSELGGRFVVGEVIGIGGSSTVYMGWHKDLDCPVAIKVLNRGVARDGALSGYFLREAMVTARLVGPHAVHVYDRGTLDDGTPFTVMEHLRGETLEQLLDRVGYLQANLAVELAHQVCTLLIEAHAQGVAHCDIKPENLFLTELPEGRRLLKVIDFGTARGPHTPEYIWTSCVGTPGYMAPEQIQDPERVDFRADIWAVGVVLFQMVSGALPFSRTTRGAVMSATLNDEPRPLSDVMPHLPSLLVDIVERCLAKAPEARFESAEELAAALRALRRQMGDAARAERTSTIPPKSERRLIKRRVFTAAECETLHAPIAEAPRPARRTANRRKLGAAMVLAGAGALLGAWLPSSKTRLFLERAALFGERVEPHAVKLTP